MQSAEERITEFERRMQALRAGKAIECPYCKREGGLRMVNEAVYVCDSCGKGIIYRIPLHDLTHKS